MKPADTVGRCARDNRAIQYDTAGVAQSRAAGEQDEGDVTDHGDEEGEEGAYGDAARRVLQVAGYVGAGLDPGHRGEENGEDREEGLVAALRVTVVRPEVRHEYVAC